MILEGVFQNGDALPSVRRIASEHRINPITVSKAYQILVDDGLVEKKTGLGMYVGEGAREQLLEDERRVFIDSELPEFRDRAQQLHATVNVDLTFFDIESIIGLSVFDQAICE